jgi:hypothetical protein
MNNELPTTNYKGFYTLRLLIAAKLPKPSSKSEAGLPAEATA